MACALRVFNDFIGQRRNVKFILRLIGGAKEKGKPRPALLLTAPSGSGKTSYAHAIAQEVGSDLHVLLAGDDIRAVDVCHVLYQLKHADVFFIDEAHSLERNAQEVLYTALDQNKTPARHEGRLNRTQLHSVAAFTRSPSL